MSESFAQGATSMQALYVRIARPLLEVAPPGWVELRTLYVAAGKASEARDAAVMADGSTANLRGVDNDQLRALRELRAVMYQPGTVKAPGTPPESR